MTALAFKVLAPLPSLLCQFPGSRCQSALQNSSAILLEKTSYHPSGMCFYAKEKRKKKLKKKNHSFCKKVPCPSGFSTHTHWRWQNWIHFIGEPGSCRARTLS